MIPKPFFEVRVHQINPLPGLSGLCAGYELGEWRHQQLAGYLMEWLPQFALKHSEVEGLDADNAIRLLAKAASAIYTSEKYQKRGELGELLLHVVIRQIFQTIPAISKIFYKDSNNDTVKGFDAVHVLLTPEGLELWLGEAKFYESISGAINDVAEELNHHISKNYLRNEFIAISNKLDPAWPFYEKLKLLLDINTSFDEIFQCLRVPVLLTYDSLVLKNYDKICAEYISSFEEEIRKHHQNFSSKQLPPVSIHLFLVPLNTKAKLQESFHQRLKACQQIL